MTVKKAPKKSAPRRLAEVRAIYPRGGQFNTETAHACVSELIARGTKGLILISVDPRGEVETRLFGTFTRSDIAWAGHELLHEAFRPA